MDHLDDLKKVYELRGGTFSSGEVFDLIGWAAVEIERLQADNMATLRQHSNMAGELVLARDEIVRLQRIEATARTFMLEQTDENARSLDDALGSNFEQDADDRERASEIRDDEPSEVTIRRDRSEWGK